MRIHDAYTKLDRASLPGRPADARKGESVSGSSTEGADHATQVTVSSRARDLSAMAAPRAAKVEALRAKLERGEFQIDAQAIAAKLLGDVET